MLDQADAELTRARKRVIVARQHMIAIGVIIAVCFPLTVFVIHSWILVAVEWVLLGECLASQFSSLRKLRKNN